MEKVKAKISYEDEKKKITGDAFVGCALSEYEDGINVQTIVVGETKRNVIIQGLATLVKETLDGIAGEDGVIRKMAEMDFLARLDGKTMEEKMLDTINIIRDMRKKDEAGN